MLYLPLEDIPKNTDFRGLYDKYLGKAPDGKPTRIPNESDFSYSPLPFGPLLIKERWRRVVNMRDCALSIYLSHAAFMIESEITLKSLGGKRARLRGHLGRAIELVVIERRIKLLQGQRNRQRRDNQLPFAEFNWYMAMKFAHEGRGRFTSGQVSALCHWLSIPEIGLRCTPDTLRQARRRIRKDEDGYLACMPTRRRTKDRAVST